jgi:hypothetical protein
MIWLAWRQFRAQAIGTGCVLAVFALVFVVTGLGLAHVYDTSGLPGCISHHDCSNAVTVFQGQFKGSIYSTVALVGIGLIYVAPALMGVFWGAPLVAREYETGTLRLAWNQSVSRNRWLIVKVAMIGLIAMAVAGLLSLVLSWYDAPVYKASQLAPAGNGFNVNRFLPVLFGTNGIVPIGYAAFGFALGLTVGLLLRRTVPAMAVTLAAFAAVQIAWPNLVRPHLITPVSRTVPLNPAAINLLDIQSNNNAMTVIAAVSKPGVWVLSNQTVDRAGQVFTGPATPACMDGSPQACSAWLATRHLSQLVSYQPDSRYWAFQWYETAIFLAVAVVLALFCAVLVGRRRLS